MAINESQLLASINQHYEASSLKKIIKIFLLPLKKAGKINLPIPLTNSDIEKIPKGQLSNFLLPFFTDPKMFKLLFDLIPETVQNAIMYLTWTNTVITGTELEKILKCKIVNIAPQQMLTLDQALAAVEPEFMIIPCRANYNHTYYSRGEGNFIIYLFFIQHTLQKALKELLPKPKNYELSPSILPKKEFSFFNAEEGSLAKINLIFNYLTQNPVAYNQSNMIMKSYYKKMEKECQIKEFYPEDSDTLRYLRTHLMIIFLEDKARSIKNIQNPPEYLKELFKDFFAFKKLLRFSSIRFLTSFLQKIFPSSIEKKEPVLRENLLSLLKMMQLESWYSIEDFIAQVVYKDLDIDIIVKEYDYSKPPFIKQYLKKNSSFSGDWQIIELDRHNYQILVQRPLIQGFFALLCAFGLVECAYTEPENKHIWDRKNNYLSPYEGIKYVKLTNLGAYILDKTDNYHFTETEDIPKPELSSTNLYIKIQKPNKILELLLKKVAHKVTDTCYKVTFSSFLTDCHFESDVDKQIEFFKNNISKELPPIWQEFLTEVRSKIDPLLPVKTKYFLFKIKESKELMQLLTKDPVLAKLILKAEDHHILIAYKDMVKVKKRMEEAGYLITF